MESESESVGLYLKRNREAKRMSVAEVSRLTRVPAHSVERIEAERFDELPGEVFVRGFLRSYARALDLDPDDVLARYSASRQVAWVTPLPLTSPGNPARNRRRFGVAIAFVLLLILFTLALSIVLRPRGHDVPQELSNGLDSGSERSPDRAVSRFNPPTGRAADRAG